MPTPAEHAYDPAVGVRLRQPGLDHRFGQRMAMRFGPMDVAHGFVDVPVSHPGLKPPGVDVKQGRCEATKTERLLYERERRLTGGYLLLA